MARPRSLRLRTTWPPLVAPAGSATPPAPQPARWGCPLQGAATSATAPRHGPGPCQAWNVAALRMLRQLAGGPPGGQGKTGGLGPPFLIYFFVCDLHSLSAHGELRCGG